MSALEPIESPCVRVCAVDGARGICIGCGRTLKEIASWTALAPQERRAIMDALPERLATLPVAPGSP
jgi:predicted Fe-S protein YdhL (DUF1289 family)